MPRIVVASHNQALRRALRVHLEGANRADPVEAVPFEGVSAGDVVLTSTSDCSEAQCSRLTGAGVHVIVLAALPEERARQAYLSAGCAAYLPMLVDSLPLLDVIHRLQAPRARSEPGTTGIPACP